MPGSGFRLRSSSYGERVASHPPSTPASIVVVAMPVVATDEFGNALDHLRFDAGVAVLGKAVAWIGRDRVAMGEGMAVLAR